MTTRQRDSHAARRRDGEPRASGDVPPVAWMHRWQILAPLALVMVALVAMMAMPIIGEWYVRPLRDETRTLLEPARALVTRIHVSLALEGSTLHDYLDTSDPGLLQRYRVAAAQEQAAFRELAPLASQLGTDMRERLDEVQRLQRQWHDLVQAQLERKPGTPNAAQREQLYDDLVTSAAGLDQAMDDVLRASRNRVDAADRMQRIGTVVLGILAIIATAVVGWLGRELRLTAAENQARRMQLERVVEARARLMRGVSHDLKNPLNAIDGHAQILADGVLGTLSASQQDSVRRIRRAVRSLLGLIDDLLELARAETGHLSISMRPVVLGEAVLDVAEEHRPAVEGSGHRLELAIEDGATAVVTDPKRVSQILGNLFSNAIKYTPQGGCITVRVSRKVRAAADHTEWAAVDVADTGPGIPADKLDHIFEEFSRLAVDAHRPGAGLGLSIARRIARLLKGDLTVSSTLGHGSTFTLWLPLEETRR
jgi:signal transduction histidine kinase